MRHFDLKLDYNIRGHLVCKCINLSRPIEYDDAGCAWLQELNERRYQLRICAKATRSDRSEHRLSSSVNIRLNEKKWILFIVWSQPCTIFAQAMNERMFFWWFFFSSKLVSFVLLEKRNRLEMILLSTI